MTHPRLFIVVFLGESLAEALETEQQLLLPDLVCQAVGSQAV